MRLPGLTGSAATAGLVLWLTGAAACEKHDLGKSCGTEPAAVSEPIGGEVPVIEIVRIERDGECESFQCLSHRGLPPYCTRPCVLAAPPTPQKSCSVDQDCTGGDFARGRTGHCVDGKCVCQANEECDFPLSCGDGRCRDDDCPSGFTCAAVQEVGPLAGKRFCVLRTGCERNADCEEFGVMACRRQLCFDACLRDYHRCRVTAKNRCDELDCFAGCARVATDLFDCPDTFTRDEGLATCRDAGCFAECTPPEASCAFHRLVCEPVGELQCSCTDAASAEQANDIRGCADDQIVCQPDSTAPAWPEQSVKKLNVCVPEDA